MSHLLQNPDPKYYMERGTRCYLAFDNAHGGATVTAEITGKTTVDGKDAYDVAYVDVTRSPSPSKTKVPVANVFPTLEAVAQARKDDDSLQLKNVAEACKDAPGIVAFLLTRAELSPRERDVVMEEARRRNLYPS